MASTDVQSQISALRAEIAQLQKDFGARGSEAYETIRDRAGNAVEAARPAMRSATGTRALEREIACGSGRYCSCASRFATY